MDIKRLKLLPLLPLIGLYGCDISPKDETLVTSGGVVNKGILAQAVANAYKAGSNDQVKQVYTQVDGTFSLDDVNFEGSLYIEVTTTSQTLATCDSADGCGDFEGGLKLAGESDKNLNGRIDFGDKYFFNDPEFKLTAYIQSSENNSGRFAVTPLTHLAAEKIKDTGNVNPENINLVNAQVAELFGLDGTDISRVVPPDITDESQMQSASPAQRMYAALNAAVASASDEDTSVADVLSSLSTSFVEDGGLVANSNDPDKVTLASLQQLANDVADVVEQTLPSIDMDTVQTQIQQEVEEQLAQEPDTIVVASSNPVQTPDFDKDGIPDSEEAGHGTDPFDADSDDDGLDDGKEIELGTNPLNADTDSDSMSDGWEVLFSLDPLNPDDANEDLDNDGLINSKEYEFKTLPNNEDTDGDGLKDGDEVNTHGTSPTSIDSDGDGLTDADELNTYNTNPTNIDSDGDSMGDGWEVLNNLDPLDNADGVIDSDGDGLLNHQEHSLNLNPNSQDSDGDGVNDDLEDADGDGATNYEEFTYGLNPQVDDANTDTDGDSIIIIDEFRNGSDPNVPNPAIEFISDAQIYANTSTGSVLMDVREDSFLSSSYDLSDKNFIDGVTDNNTLQDLMIHHLSLDQYAIPIRQNLSTLLLTSGSTTLQDATMDGKTVVFSSFSTQIDDADTNAATDLFTFDRMSNAVQRLEMPAEFNGDNYPGKISRDGRFIVMKTAATNLGPTDTNGQNDIYLYDRVNNQMSLVSRNSALTDSANAISYEPDISGDGNLIVFASNASDLGPSDINGSSDVYLYDRINNSMNRVSTSVDIAEDDTSTPPNSDYPMISANGKAVVYATQKDILDIGNPSYQQFYYYDTGTQETFLITKSFDNSNGGYGDSFIDPSTLQISSDGEFVFYKSASQNLVSTDTNSASLDDLFVWDRTSKTNHIISQYVYGDNGTTYDSSPVSHTNAMGIQNYVVNSDGSAIYAILDYGDEYTTAPAACAGSFTYCLYKIKLFMAQTDTDGDGLTDREEIALGSNVAVLDSDGDGLNDNVEVNTHKTSPIHIDSDGDSFSDGNEVSNGTDPIDPMDFPPP